MLHEAEQPEAGPSSRPYVGSISPTSLGKPGRSVTACPLGAQCPFLSSSPPSASPDPLSTLQLESPRRRVNRSLQHKRQDPSSSPSSSPQPITPSSTSTGILFDGPTTTVNSTTPYPTTSSPTYSYNNTAPTQPSNTTSSALEPSSETFTAPWTYTPTRTTSSSAPSQTPYVPGVILNLNLAGDSESQAVYSVPMSFGHGAQSAVDSVFPSRRRKRRPPSSDVGGIQTVNMQVDLGSSDLWVASDTCSSSDCKSAPALLDASQSLDAGVSASLLYQAGSISGDVYWEEVELGDFGIGYQAFILATTVTDEGLSGGNYTGVLGFALPANSIIQSKVPGTTGSNPDGATFLDNLFGSGLSAPTQRLFSLALGRREDVRTTSFLGIGAVSTTLCPSPCTPSYIPIVARASLGTTGFLYWRVPLQSITVTTWSDPQRGGGITTTNVLLGPSQSDPGRSSPLAVLDSGGVSILVGYKAYADVIYSAYGISASSDGLYRMPCTLQLALTFNFAGQQYPVHPLDMSWPDPKDPSQTTCIGAIQYSSSLGNTGDFILGSSFLKNVYSIFQYPDQDRATARTWQPTVGMVSLTNASAASMDFYAVRSLHQSLSTVSAAQQSISPSTNPSATSSQTSASGSTATGHKIVSTAVIAAVSVVGFFVLTAATFCAWWFWLRRKFGASGRVDSTAAAAAAARPRPTGHRSDLSSSSLRSKKHDTMQRQKSMIEGYSDYEGDSWRSTTEGGDSIRLGYMPELLEEDEGRKSCAADRSSAGSTFRDSSVDPAEHNESQLIDVTEPASANPTDLAPVVATRIAGGRRGASPSAVRSIAFTTPALADTDSPPPRNTGSYTQPRVPSSSSALSLSMTGPFPSSGRQSLVRPDASPMYDIRSNDYFNVAPAKAAAPVGRGRDVHRVSSGLETREGSESRGRRPSPQPTGWIQASPVVEEPSTFTL